MSRELKVTKVGNSAAVLLPKELLAQLRVAIGDRLFVGDMPHGISLSARDEDFVTAMTAAEEIMREDRDILAVLAR
ncbi:MAG: AbrB/MazE/SpoVT family DNA-binding domain-containing protein [Pseudomonadota bacterium]